MSKTKILTAILCLVSFVVCDVSRAKPEGTITKEQRQYERKIESVVRNKHFYKTGRFELTGQAGLMPYDSLINHYMIGGRLTWHLADHYGWEIADIVVPFPSVTGYTTSLVGRLGLGDVQTPELNLIIGSNFLISPLYGKVRFVGNMILHFDLYVVVGFGVAKTNTLKVFSLSANTEPTIETIRSTLDPMGTVGLGVKCFLNDAMGLLIDFRDYVIVTRLYDETRLQSNFSIFAGLTFFLPTFG